MVFCGFLPRLVFLWMHISAVMWLCGLLAAGFEYICIYIDTYVYIYMYENKCMYEGLGKEKFGVTQLGFSST